MQDDESNQFDHSRRRANRKRVLWSGQLLSDARLLSCAILDISLLGARVQLDQQSTVLAPIAKIAMSTFGNFQSAVVWQRDRIAGLRFLEPPGRVADTIGRQMPLTMNDL